MSVAQAEHGERRAWLRRLGTEAYWLPLLWLPILVGPPALGSGSAARPWLVWLELAAVTAAIVAATAFGRLGPRPGWIAETGLAVALAGAAAVTLAGTASATALFGMVAICIGVSVRRRLVGPAVVVAAAAALMALRLAGSDWSQAWWQGGFTTFLSGASTYAFARLSETIGQLHATRESLARAAVAAERDRFARDLHDLLGHTLSVIVVKAETVRRLADRDTGLATKQAGDIEALGRQALREVRDAVEGYRTRSVAEEIVTARSALASVGVRLVYDDTNAPALPQRTDVLLAWVVREACTNVVRHAQARQCRVALTGPDPVRLTIEDDGTGAPAEPASRTGHGLHGLSERLAAAGGWLAANGGPRGFRVVAQLPAAQEQAPPASRRVTVG